jgi:hypothetical protein
VAAARKAAAAAALRDRFAGGGGERVDAALAVPADVLRRADALARGACAGDGEERARDVTAVVAEMLPYLTPGELRTFWDAVDTRRCGAPAGGPAASWVAMLRAIGDRDAGRMEALAGALLEDADPPDEPLRFLVLTGMLASTMQGDVEGACRLWARHRASLSRGGDPGLQFRLLAGACPAEGAAP